MTICEIGASEAGAGANGTTEDVARASELSSDAAANANDTCMGAGLVTCEDMLDAMADTPQRGKCVVSYATMQTK